MRKINYPTDIRELAAFHRRYLNALSNVPKGTIDTFLLKAPKYKGHPLTLERLCVLPLEDILKVETILRPFAKGYNRSETVGTAPNQKTIERNDFLELFNYKKNQKLIARFFRRERKLNLKICCYCGIDYINSFIDLADYNGAIDFLNNADYKELNYVAGIGSKIAKRIISHREHTQITDLDDPVLNFNTALKCVLGSYNLMESHDHFTLDHVLPKKVYGYFSLCLYNLVPSCYSCNAKFKKEKDFGALQSLLKISPTSPVYSMSNDIRFKLEYSGDIKKITKTSDFILKLVSTTNFREVNMYDRTFKLTGRYLMHKDELLKLIKQKINNPDSEIKRKAKLLKISPRELKEYLYGKELFKDNLQIPMHKFKRDVAESLKIVT